MSTAVLTLEGGYQLRTSPDGMEAWLEPPPSPAEYPSLREKLKEVGLTGLLDPPVREDGRLIVARGRPPEPGEDGKIEFLVDFSRGPREISPHRVDWREVNALVSVPAGTVVARITPPTPGIPGLTVWGEPVPAQPGRKIRIREELPSTDQDLAAVEDLIKTEEKGGQVDLTLGPGLIYDSREGTIVAREGGFLELRGKHLRLYPVYTLGGDVDWTTGNIRFYGKKLTIKGTVRRGFLVESAGDLEIHGNVEDGVRIQTGGSLIVQGIVKGERIEVHAEREAFLNIVEYASVKVRGNLTVSGYLLQARVIVGGMLSVMGKEGILGGEVFVEGSAVVSVLGSPAFVKTLIKVGYNYEVAEEVKKLEEEFSRLDEVTDRMKEALVQGIRLARAGRLTPEKRVIVEKLYQVLKKRILEMADIKERIKALETRLDKGDFAFLQVTMRAYPNVVVGIGKNAILLKKEHGPGIFRLEGAKIAFRGQN
ncbi:FapA family protein [Thermosulfurimonas sp. F29]|uniref:FapA family protein n=1 Tax=Thermosulfurimonas sp. F29 TaxID=2867247 RepID=UPI001C83CEA3|nr:FapA family protein [Thermosulfurimonas sp. F29]MBX6422523.1 FapA family protein [Thermosulfurimonas sp. F29]